MDELYTQSFFQRSAPVKGEGQPLFKSPISSENDENKQLAEVYEITNQMSFYLDRLEKALENEFKETSDFQFIFRKVRQMLFQKKTDGIDKLFAELEDLLDVSN